MVDDKRPDVSGRLIDAAQRVVREQWPDWMRRNRDSVHVPVRSESDRDRRAGLGAELRGDRSERRG